jgi:hypothetical protein
VEQARKADKKESSVKIDVMLLVQKVCHRIALKYSTSHCIKVQYNSSVQCIALQYSALQA